MYRPPLRTGRPLASHELPTFITQNRDLWRLLEIDARHRVAAFPFVLVNLRFRDTASWQRAKDGHLMSISASPAYNGVTAKLFEDLLLETLLFGRQAAREDVSVAKAMFGMSSSVAGLIASLSLPQVRAIALGNSQQLRVRWDGDPTFWGDLLIAFRFADEDAMDVVRRQGKLLFCGEIVSSQD